MHIVFMDWLVRSAEDHATPSTSKGAGQLVSPDPQALDVVMVGTNRFSESSQFPARTAPSPLTAHPHPSILLHTRHFQTLNIPPQFPDHITHLIPRHHTLVVRHRPSACAFEDRDPVMRCVELLVDIVPGSPETVRPVLCRPVYLT